MKIMTELMDKIFSDSTPEEFKEKVSEKIDEAKDKGTAELKTADDHLSFAEVDGDVVIEDKKNGNEVTVAKEDGTGETKLEPVVEATKKHSASQPDVVAPATKGVDGEKLTGTLKDAEVPRVEGVDGKSFSLVIPGFSSVEEAQQAFSEIQESLSNETLSFSEDSLENVAFSINQLTQDFERLLGTANLNLAYSIVDEAEGLKAYSVLAEDYGHNLDDVYEAASYFSEQAQNMIYSTMEDASIQEVFSELEEDEIQSLFSELDEDQSDVLFSMLESGENYTFSDCDEAVAEVKAKKELDTPVTNVLKTEEDVADAVKEMSDIEAEVFFSMLEENPNLTFSEVNEAFEELNTPLQEMFSEMSEEEVNQYFSEMNEEEVAIFSEVVEDENATYSDYLERVAESRVFSDSDCEVLASNATELTRAYSDMVESGDPELAKKVKVLADATVEDAEKAEESGHDAEQVKKMCSQYSEDAAKILDKAGVKLDPAKDTVENILEGKEETPSEAVEKTKTQSFSDLGVNGQRVFSNSTVPTEGSFNSCLTSKIN